MLNCVLNVGILLVFNKNITSQIKTVCLYLFDCLISCDITKTTLEDKTDKHEINSYIKDPKSNDYLILHY
jgi:hypothetical protein